MMTRRKENFSLSLVSKRRRTVASSRRRRRCRDRSPFTPHPPSAIYNSLSRGKAGAIASLAHFQPSLPSSLPPSPPLLLVPVVPRSGQSPGLCWHPCFIGRDLYLRACLDDDRPFYSIVVTALMRIAVGYRRDRWRLRESVSRRDVSAFAYTFARVFEHSPSRDGEIATRPSRVIILVVLAISTRPSSATDNPITDRRMPQVIDRRANGITKGEKFPSSEHRVHEIELAHR